MVLNMKTNNSVKLDINSRWELNDGNTMPIVGLGTWEAQGKDVENAVFHAIESGYRHIDTAKIYGNEEQVGAGVRRAISELGISRAEIFVTTKLWNSDHANVQRAFDDSLRRLGLDYIDLYLMHFPVAQRLESWKVMEKIKQSGKAKSIGVSNFMVPHLEALLAVCKILPSVNQVEMTPLLYQKELIEFCKGKNILLQAYSPLLRGQRLDDPAFVKIANAHHKTVAQVLLRWCLQHGLVPLPKSVTPSRIEENIALFDFELTSAEMRTLNSLNENLRLCWDPTTAP